MAASPHRLAIALAALGALGAGAAGCPSENRRVVTQGTAHEQPQLVGDETPAQVEDAWGKPDRRIEVLDEKTGRTRTIWVYERFLDTNGSKLDTMVTFDGGRVTRVERQPIPRAPATEGLPRDSAAKRDME